MIPTQEIGQGDTGPDLEIQLQRPDGSFPDITGATIVCRVVIDACGCSRVFESTPTIIDARGGYIAHAWATNETQAPGLLRLYFSVLFPGQSDSEAFPWWGYYTVRVKAAVGNL